MFEINGKYTTAKVMIDNVEQSCIAQITGMVNHPAFTNPISIMPDTHAGKGSVIGFTMPMTEKVIAAIVGVDIGCGMLAMNIGPEFDMRNDRFDRAVRKAVPFGYDTHQRGIIHMKNDFPWKDVRSTAHNFSLAHNKKFGTNTYFIGYDMDWFEKKCNDIGCPLGRAINSIGTLGGGNHFIEVGKADDGNHWIVIHTGSRNLGKCIADYWQNMGSKVVRDQKNAEFQRRIAEIKEKYKGMEIKKQIKKARKDLGLDTFGNDKLSKELQWLDGECVHGYLYDMIFAQKYAEVNRAYIAKLIIDATGFKVLDQIETVHNFIDFRDFVVRKGSIRSYVGERMIIPFNPHDGILICEGKSNPDWNYSAPHGAGRLMSRTEAKKRISDEDADKAMDGVYASEKPKDESPLAYKPAKEIEDAIGPTATIINRIKPIINMKAGK